MRISHSVTALAAFTAGLTAAATLHRRAHRSPVTPTITAATIPSIAPSPDHDGVVLAFARPVLAGPGPEQPAQPARCGESGGRTKAGAPCGARTTGGRCHHHAMAA